MEKRELKEVELRSEELQDVMGKVPHWILRWGIVVLFGTVVVLFVGSAFFSYPDIIQAPIVLTGSTPPAGIIAFSSGKLDLLNTRDNQEVNSGIYLAVIQNPALTDDVLYLKHFLDELDLEQDSVFTMPEKNLQLGNLQTLYASFYINLYNYNDFMSQQYYPKRIRMAKERIPQFEEQYKSLLRQQIITEEQTALIDKYYERSTAMHEQGAISGRELDDLKSRQLQGQLSEENMQNAINSMRIQLAQLDESVIEMEYQYLEKTNDMRSQIRSMVSQLKANIKSWEMSYVLISPIDGKVTFTRYWVSNQNVLGGEEVFTVIPSSESRIIGKAMLPVARSGKVEIGQNVNIRLDNFPDNEFGTLKGTVQNISLVPASSGNSTYYVVEIELLEGLNTNYKKELPYLPNMSGMADVITENMSLMERFVMPMKKIFKEGYNKK